VKGRAEIAGAGLAGLTAAIALAERGWKVRVHERAPSLRSEGFAITIHANGLRVLRALGAWEAATREANLLAGSELRNARDEVVSSTRFRARSVRASRFALVSALAARAAALGVELRFNSGIASADPGGNVLFEDGETLAADLVVAADGVNSSIREGLGLVESRTVHDDGAMRVVIPGTLDPDTAGKVIEWWSGTRRIIFGACSPSEIYVALSCRAEDGSGRRIPLDRASWTQAFPFNTALFERIERDADWPHVVWMPFQLIRLKSWSAGRVAVVGDAAHAMPPNLGQGGGCAMMNALGLAVALEQAETVEVGLAAWEARERPLTEHTQRWSRLYSSLATWPRLLRQGAFWMLSRKPLQARYRRTANHVPTGTEHLAGAG
jgi:2-polyprenyl-6-methoxyphenol hydroxylase-like FAD-dependent oxidoreductase